jgi:hypothetical protein
VNWNLSVLKKAISGILRTHSEARKSDIRQMDADMYSGDPPQHSDRSSMHRINAKYNTEHHFIG